ncbi:hypothetical protein [Sediminibacterium roseum]|uniref:hypothetical protein n=1 Tax=Sediminibacterium roseum TaxID=1978412 RepID=UPI00192A18F0|nr:hypothetical protein [Sediminibacterium roseum]
MIDLSRIFFVQTLVNAVYQPHYLILPGGSKISSIKNELFRKDRTYDPSPSVNTAFFKEITQVHQVIDGLLEEGIDLFEPTGSLDQLIFQLFDIGITFFFKLRKLHFRDFIHHKFPPGPFHFLM